MAFKDELFPDVKLVHGIVKQITDPVGIVSNGNKEFRIKKNRFSRLSWSIPSNNMTEETKLQINGFLADKDYALDSFKFKDPDYPAFTDAILQNKTGNIWYVNIPFDDNTPGTHPIFQFDATTSMRASVNGTGSIIVNGMLSIDADGRPIVTIPTTVDSDIVRLTGDIYFAVRLDSTTGWSLKALSDLNTPSIVNYSEIKLIEVFET